MHQYGPMVKWPKTSASHADNGGSNPPRVTKCGVDYDEDPPVPIPNTVGKLIRAENTWRAASRENRSMPQQKRTVLAVLFLLPENPQGRLFLLCLGMVRRKTESSRASVMRMRRL